jgi:hypothetical protein
MRCAHRIVVERQEGNKPVGRLSTGGRITLKSILKGVCIDGEYLINLACDYVEWTGQGTFELTI